jgi:hypothetical protein
MRSAQAGRQLDHYVVEDLFARSNIFRGTALFYGMLAMIRFVIFGLLLFVARRQ